MPIYENGASVSGVKIYENGVLASPSGGGGGGGGETIAETYELDFTAEANQDLEVVASPVTIDGKSTWATANKTKPNQWETNPNSNGMEWGDDVSFSDWRPTNNNTASQIAIPLEDLFVADFDWETHKAVQAWIDFSELHLEGWSSRFVCGFLGLSDTTQQAMIEITNSTDNMVCVMWAGGTTKRTLSAFPFVADTDPAELTTPYQVMCRLEDPFGDNEVKIISLWATTASATWAEKADMTFCGRMAWDTHEAQASAFLADGSASQARFNMALVRAGGTPAGNPRCIIRKLKWDLIER